MQRLLELGKTQHGISGKSTGGAGSRGRLVGPGKNQLDLERLAENISGWQNYCRPLYLDGCDKMDFRGASMI